MALPPGHLSHLIEKTLAEIAEAKLELQELVELLKRQTLLRDDMEDKLRKEIERERKSKSKSSKKNKIMHAAHNARAHYNIIKKIP